jgi:predicted anti-sigma-YlaC factor YlaD
MIRSTLRRLTGFRWPPIEAGEQMSCSEVARLLQRYLDGELERQQEIDALAAHLDVCPPCGIEAATYEKIKASLAERSPELPDESIERLRGFARGLVDN